MSCAGPCGLEVCVERSLACVILSFFAQDPLHFLQLQLFRQLPRAAWKASEHESTAPADGRVNSDRFIMGSFPKLFCERNQTKITFENSYCTVSKSMYVYVCLQRIQFHPKQLISYSICFRSFWFSLEQKWDQKAGWRSIQCTAKRNTNLRLLNLESSV